MAEERWSLRSMSLAGERNFLAFTVPLRPTMDRVAVVLNSARLSPVPLVFKTVRETFTSHGSSMIWCLSRIPHYPIILDFLKPFGGLRFGTIAAGFVTGTAIVGGLCVVAVSV